MRDEWNGFLQAAGARMENGRVADYGDARGELGAAAGSSVVADLGHLGLICASGPEAQSFLQTQLTNDVMAVDATHSQLAAYLTPKGRALALFRIWKDGDEFRLLLPRERVEPVLKRLRMYVLRTKVTLRDASDERVLFGWSHPLGAPAAMTLPGCADEVTSQADVTVIRLPGPRPRYLFDAAPGAAASVWNALRARPVGAAAWEWLEIEAGQPQVYAETAETFIPQMLNLDLLNGVSFKKGCYPGQEIVARLRYLGQLKRRMTRLYCTAAELPAPGTPLYASEQATQATGEVVRAAPSPEGGIEMLAVVELASMNLPRLSLAEPAGPHCTFRQLSYALTD